MQNILGVAVDAKTRATETRSLSLVWLDVTRLAPSALVAPIECDLHEFARLADGAGRRA